MPSIGNARQLGISEEQLEAKQRIVDSGIPLFEVVKRKNNNWPQKDFGFWDCRVRESVNPTTFEMNTQVQWHNGETAYVEYTPNKRGIATAWIPDDDAWHNRIQLASILPTGQIVVQRRHVRDEPPMSGSMATSMLSAIYRYIHEWRLETKPADKKHYECIATSKRKSDLEPQLQELIDAGQPAALRVGKIAELAEVIKRDGPRWLMSKEFLTVHRPRLEQIIEQQIAPMRSQVASVAESLKASIVNLSDVERRSIFEMLVPPELRDKLVTTAAAAVDSRAETLDDIESIRRLRQIARQHNVVFDPKSLDKTKLRQLIKERLAGIVENDVDAGASEMIEDDGIEMPPAPAEEEELVQ